VCRGKLVRILPPGTAFAYTRNRLATDLIEQNETLIRKMSTYLEYSEVILTDGPNSGTGDNAGLRAKVIERGTFAGTIYQLGLLENDELVACDTGEQGGGQN